MCLPFSKPGICERLNPIRGSSQSLEKQSKVFLGVPHFREFSIFLCHEGKRVSSGVVLSGDCPDQVDVPGDPHILSH